MRFEIPEKNTFVKYVTLGEQLTAGRFSGEPHRVLLARILGVEETTGRPNLESLLLAREIDRAEIDMGRVRRTINKGIFELLDMSFQFLLPIAQRGTPEYAQLRERTAQLFRERYPEDKFIVLPND